MIKNAVNPLFLVEGVKVLLITGKNEKTLALIQDPQYLRTMFITFKITMLQLFANEKL